MSDKKTKSNNENEMLCRAQELLKMWAAWVNQTAHQQLGYPKSAPYVVERVDNDYGGAIDSPDAERIDHALCKLKATDFKVYAAIESWYLHGKDRIEASHFCRCSKAAFDSRKRYGEWFIAGTLK